MTIDLATAKKLFEQSRLRELLQVPANAHSKELEKACKLARARHHPDKGGNHNLACVIDAAISKLLDNISKGIDNERTYSWKFTYMGGRKFVNEREYETKLRRECEILESGLRTAKECIEKCGYGSQRPPCTETCDCQCTGHHAQRLRDVIQDLDVLMSWAEDVLHDAGNASNVGSDEELNLMDRLRDLLAKTKDIKHFCSARASLFDVLGKMPRQRRQRQAEHQEPQTTTSMDSASSARPEQPPQDTGIGTEPRAEEQDQEMPAKTDHPRAEEHHQEHSCEECIETPWAAKSVEVNHQPDGLQQTPAEVNHQPDGWHHTTAEVNHALPEPQQNKRKERADAKAGSSLDRSLFAIRFPRVSLKMQEHTPGKAMRLKQLWQEYRKVGIHRCKRLERDQPTNDLDERATILKRSAWRIVQE